MSASSWVGVISGETVNAVYCASNSYLYNMGSVLCYGYTDKSKILNLLSTGGVKTLGFNINYPICCDVAFLLENYDRLNNIHFLTSFSLPLEDSRRRVRFQGSLGEFVEMCGDAEFLYLFNLYDHQWYVFSLKKNGKIRRYKLHNLMTDKEFYYRFRKETGNELDNWRGIKNLYSMNKKQFESGDKLVKYFNVYIQHELKQKDYLIRQVHLSEWFPDDSIYELLRIEYYDKNGKPFYNLVSQSKSLLDFVIYLIVLSIQFS